MCTDYNNYTKKYYGKISYTMDANHPDIKYAEDWTEDKVYTYQDKYCFTEDWEKEDIISHIKHDLKLVAGGGYNTNHIHNVEFFINKI